MPDNKELNSDAPRLSCDSLIRKVHRRLGQSISHFQFSCKRGNSLPQAIRLFYHVELKPSLAFRGLVIYSPQRILTFSVKAAEERTFQVDVHDDGVEVGTIVEFFSPQSKIVPRNLPLLHPKVVYDLGANIGIASLYFAAVYPAAKIYGFEPLPLNYETCLKNYQNLQRAQVFPWAVGVKSGVATFDCSNDVRGGRLESSPRDPHLRTVNQIDVQVYSIADLIRVKDLEPPEFLKVDVEGAELDVLKGMEGYDRGVKRIYIETHGPELKRECLRWMSDRGYKFWHSEDDTAIWGDRL